VLDLYRFYSDSRKAKAKGQDIYPGQLFLGVDLPTICSRFLSEYVEPNLSAASVKTYTFFLDRLLKHMKNQPAYVGMGTTEETRQCIKVLLREVRDKERKPTLCNRMRSCYSSMFKWAMEYDLVKDTPMTAMPTAKEKPKGVLLEDDELRLWLRVIAEGNYKQYTKDALRLILLTGMRSGEVLSLTPAMIDLENARIVLPCTKNGSNHLVVLSKRAICILERNLRGVQKYKRIFSTSTWGLRQVCQRASKRAKVTVVSPHDLRRTFATLCGKLAVDPHLIGRLLNHTQPGVTQRHYALYQYEKEKREACQLVADHLERLGPI